MRPIDADAPVEKICGESCGCHRNECGFTYEEDGCDSCAEVREIEEAPTIDAAPVRRGMNLWQNTPVSPFIFRTFPACCLRS